MGTESTLCIRNCKDQDNSPCAFYWRGIFYALKVWNGTALGEKNVKIAYWRDYSNFVNLKFEFEKKLEFLFQKNFKFDFRNIFNSIFDT